MLPPGGDWTVSFDDHLVARWGQGCTLCARGPVLWAWTREVCGMAIGICLCARCHQQDPQHQRVDALLVARYAPQRFPHISHAKGRGEVLCSPWLS